MPEREQQSDPVEPLAVANGHTNYSSINAPKPEEETDSVKKRTFTEKFKQQSFSAWQPVYSARTISPALIILGLIFIPLGIFLWKASEGIKELRIPYEDCLNVNFNPPEEFNVPCSTVINTTETSLVKNCRCRLNFQLDKNYEEPVYIYYALTNFYQNHRKYVTSRDLKQLSGEVGEPEDPKEPSGDCGDWKKTPDEDGARIYFPCGAIANSMFSDQITISYKVPPSENSTPETIQVPLKRTGIAWESDKKWKFDNPDWFYDRNDSDPIVAQKFAKPMHWRRSLWELDPENPDNNGLKNEDLIVWMRTAALPNFRKLFRIVDSKSDERPEFKIGLPAGNYTLEIDYAFAVSSFKGNKSIIISTTSIVGAPNDFLGMTYVIVGSVCVILGVFLIFVHVSSRRRNAKVVHVD